ncbi:MAG: ATPase domain-containing protein [Nitrososphaerota archaeon]|nr:hypothetical protein [Candidatus Bathyarchaeota archaeon]MDW8049145.1 ATPase domain-containing protein [Nitrososphaerota archaeon]
MRCWEAVSLGESHLALRRPRNWKNHFFRFNFLVAAAERGELGIYVTLEEPKRLVLENVEGFGWNLREKEMNRTFKMLDFCTVPLGISTYEMKNRESEEIIFL